MEELAGGDPGEVRRQLELNGGRAGVEVRAMLGSAVAAVSIGSRPEGREHSERAGSYVCNT